MTVLNRPSYPVRFVASATSNVTAMPALAARLRAKVLVDESSLACRVDSQVGVGPGADDPAGPMSLAAGGEQVIGALERDEAARVTGQPEDLTRVLDADRVVGGRVQDEQRQAQAFDLVVQVSRADILDECPLEGQLAPPAQPLDAVLG